MWTLRKKSIVKSHKIFVLNVFLYHKVLQYFLILFQLCSGSILHPSSDIIIPGHYKVTVSVFQGSSECPVHCVTEWRPGEEMAEAVLRQELSNFHETVSHFSAH